MVHKPESVGHLLVVSIGEQSISNLGIFCTPAMCTVRLRRRCRDEHRTSSHPAQGRLPIAGVVLIGDPQSRQIGPALTTLMSRRRLRRCVMIGSDYIFHRFAAQQILAADGSVVSSRLVQSGLHSTDADELVELLSRRGADAVLLSLIGSDLAVFNRAFARAGLGDRVVRLSGALEENGLLAAGGDDSGELYSAMRSFAGQADDRRRALPENRHRAFGGFAPVLDAYSPSCSPNAPRGLVLRRRPPGGRPCRNRCTDGRAGAVRGTAPAGARRQRVRRRLVAFAGRAAPATSVPGQGRRPRLHVVAHL